MTEIGPMSGTLPRWLTISSKAASWSWGTLSLVAAGILDTWASHFQHVIYPLFPGGHPMIEQLAR
jgi:hypothetical protein